MRPTRVVQSGHLPAVSRPPILDWGRANLYLWSEFLQLNSIPKLFLAPEVGKWITFTVHFYMLGVLVWGLLSTKANCSGKVPPPPPKCRYSPLGPGKGLHGCC